MECDKDFRNALGRFATGVAVVTTMDRQQRAIGMTINSFSSVSLEPKLVLWSIQNSLDCFDSFTNAERFCISVLSVDQLSISKQYSTKNNHQLDLRDYTLAKESGMPRINNALAIFDCERYQSYLAGDHTILIGQVANFESSADDQPLLFYSGNYGVLNS